MAGPAVSGCRLHAAPVQMISGFPSVEGLDAVRQAISDSGNDRLMVGFNRRFSPLVRAAGDIFRKRTSPLVMHYRVHAGQLDESSWYLDLSDQGSRFIGEAGHFLDTGTESESHNR